MILYNTIVLADEIIYPTPTSGTFVPPLGLGVGVFGVEMKTCNKCEGEPQVLDNFYRASGNVDGFQNSCKPCSRKSSSTYRLLNKEKIARWQIEYRLGNKGKLRIAAKKWRVANPDKVRRTNERFKKKHPEKRKAHRAVSREIRLGLMTKEPCFICGEQEVEAHHWNYNEEFWLDVWWVCTCHHALIHATIKPIQATEESN